MHHSSIRVLLVEDDDEDALILREMLDEVETRHAVSLNLEVAGSLKASLERLDTQGIDIILLDLNLPDSRGLDALRRFHAQAPEVPLVVLTGLNDEMLGIEAVQKGAQDYLVKGQVDGNLLLRSMRYAIERHRLLARLEESRQREQQERERSEAMRNFQHYIALTQNKEPADLDTLAGSDDETLYGMISDYRDIVLSYVRAVRIREDRPSDRVRGFAQRLAAIPARARDVVRLHLRFLNEFSQRALPAQERAFSNDARLVLVELMGNIMDIYLSVSKEQK
jgi:DNA-binding response OmpR family regulator